MATKSHRPGGGIKSRVNVSPGYRTGAPRERIRHAGVAQYGQAQGDHITEHGSTGYGGVKAHTNKPGLQSDLGNRVAAATQCGPGGSRRVMGSGSQGLHGEASGKVESAPRSGGDVMERRRG